MFFSINLVAYTMIYMLLYSKPRGKSIYLSSPVAQYFTHLTNLQAMFPWPSPAKTPLSRNGITCLLGYSQTLIDHHFMMAARFFETLKKQGLSSSTMTVTQTF